MNGTMNILNGHATLVRTQEGIPSFITRVTFPEMANLVADAEVYMAY